MSDKQYDVLSAMIDYEMGVLDTDKTIELFQYLVDTGLAWTLQGHYGRMAQDMINQGLITHDVGPHVHPARS